MQNLSKTTRSIFATMVLTTALFSANAAATETFIYNGTLATGDSTFDFGSNVESYYFDVYQFTANETGQYDFTSTAANFDLDLYLFDDTYTTASLGTGDGNLASGVPGDGDTGFSSNLTANTLYNLVASSSQDIVNGGVGAYELRLTGAVVSSVPEPESYAMFLAGLGLLGFAANRKKS